MFTEFTFYLKSFILLYRNMFGKPLLERESLRSIENCLTIDFNISPICLHRIKLTVLIPRVRSSQYYCNFPILEWLYLKEKLLPFFASFPDQTGVGSIIHPPPTVETSRRFGIRLKMERFRSSKLPTVHHINSNLIIEKGSHKADIITVRP